MKWRELKRQIKEHKKTNKNDQDGENNQRDSRM